MKRTRIPAGLLALCALLTLATACGDSAGGNAVTTAADTAGKQPNTEDTGSMDALDLRQLVDDGLGEHDFSGKVFRIGVSDNATDTYFMEEETGDVVDDAVYQRNLAVEERFNCEIEVVFDMDYGDCSDHVSKLVEAGEDAFDLLSMHVVKLGEIVPKGYFLNWYDIPNVDFTKPWWSESNINDLTHDGVCISAIGDMVLSSISNVYGIFYNKVLGNNYDFPDLYEIVDNGEWTLEYITTLTRDIYADLNQNGKVDFDQDMFGYISNRCSNLNAYLWAFDNPVYAKNGDSLEYVYKTTKVGEIITKLHDMFDINEGICCNFGDDEYVHEYSAMMFADGKAVLANGVIGASIGSFRDMEDDYAILPYPKWDEAQEAYYTMCDGAHHVIVVPTTITDAVFVGTIVEAMNAESYKTLVPAYYDVALKVKGTRDEQSVEMLDRIVNSCIFDFGYVYDAWDGVSFIVEWMLDDGNTNFESYYAKKEKSVTKHYNKVIEYFENYGME